MGGIIAMAYAGAQ